MSLVDQYESFRTAAREGGATDADVDAWLVETRFCIELRTDGAGPVVAYIGGAPVMPDAVSWPANADGEDLDFLAAVDCSALPRDAVTGVQLPADGHLLFFLNYDDTDDYDEQANSRVLHVSAGGRERQGGRAFDRVDLYPSVRFSREDGRKTDYVDPLTELAREFWPEATQPGPERMRIGGYGDVAQRDPEEAVVDVLTEQGLLPEDDAEEGLLDRIKREWMPLAQFGNPDPGCSPVNARFMARLSDLGQSRFDRVVSSAEFGS